MMPLKLGDKKMTTNGPDRSDNGRARSEQSDLQGQPAGAPRSDVDIAELSRSMLSRLSRAIETEIVPRFMLAFESQDESRPVAAGLALEERIDEMVQLVLDHEADVASKYVDALRSQGIPLSEIYLDLLAPAARRLGEMWEIDDASFAEVAIGVCRMHQVLLEFSRCFDPLDRNTGNGHCALIAPTPGEEHTFGLFMVIEFLRRGGWHCFTGAPPTRNELLELVKARHFDAVGLSLSAERHIEETGVTINDIRRVSKNSNVAIILGGHQANENPELVSKLGADGTAIDGQSTVRVLNQLCGVGNGESARGQ